MTRDQVDLERRIVRLTETKNGSARIEFEDSRPMHEPVDGRQRHGLFGEDRAPLAERC